VIRYGCNVQVIRRQAFTGDPSTGITLVGNPFPPDPNEIGWKETVRMNPSEAITVIISRTGLRVSKTEIGKTRAETGAQKPADFAASPNALRARDSADRI